MFRRKGGVINGYSCLYSGASEAAYRLKVRELVDAYAHCADRRDEGTNVPFY